MFRNRRIVSLALLSLLVLSITLVASAHQHFDLEGRTIRISIWSADVTPLGAPGEYNWFEDDPRLAAHIAEVEAMFNAKIEVIQYLPGHYHQTVEFIASDVITGVPQFEIINAREDHLYQLSAMGLIHPLTNILDHEYYASLPPSFRTKAGLQVGPETYMFESLNDTLEPAVLIWHKEMFEEHGWPNLYEVYEAGDWTWDKMREIAILATRDENRDGTIDHWGLNFVWRDISTEWLGIWLDTNDAALTRLVDGRWTVTLGEPEAIEALEFLQKLYYEDDVMYRDWQEVVEGRVAMAYSLPLVVNWDHVAEHGYRIVPLPRGPRASEHKAPLWARWGSVIPITEENPAALIELSNALFKVTEPYMDVDLDTWERQYWEREQRRYPDRESLGYANWAMQNMSLDQHRDFLGRAGLDAALRQIVYEGASVSATVAEITPSLQALLDDLYDQ